MSIQRATTWGGDYHYQSSENEITTGTFYGFTVLEDSTTVSVMKGGPAGVGDNQTNNFLTSEYTNISGKSLVKGTRVTIKTGWVIKNFDLSAGSVMLHREG